MSHPTGVADRAKPRVGISACLIGWEVRYSGGHKWNRTIVETIGAVVEWIPVCPELEIGLGVPREPIELVGDVRSPELLGVTSGRPLATLMRTWAADRLEELDRHELSGYILKARSPSCGPRGVPVYAGVPASGGPAPVAEGVGLFARALLERFPGLPVVDESELIVPAAIAYFLDRVHDYRRISRRR